MNLFIKIFKLRKRRKPTSAVSQKHYLLYKEEAREVILRRVVFFTAKYNFQYKRLAIKNTKTRWGSCSTKRNLNFNYKILFLENNLRDYIIVHELCHLQEMNHSKNFWRLVKEILPDYQNSFKKLRNINLNKLK